MRLAFLFRGAAVAAAFLTPAWAGDSPSLTTIASALQAGRATDAEAIATQMLSAPGSAPLEHAYLLLDRGLAREQLHYRKEAVADFTAAIDSRTLPPAELARAVFDRGVILDELDRAEEAIADYSRAILLVSHYAAAFNNRGNAYRRTGRYVEARADYQAALAAGDDEPEYPLYGLGRIAEAQGDPVAAKGYYERSLAANGLFTQASERLAALASSNESYSLHAPLAAAGDPPKIETVSTESQSIASHKDVSETAAVPALRPAILDAAQHTKVVQLASLIPAEHAEADTGIGDLVQLGAWHNQSDAALGWNRLAAEAGDLLNGAAPQIIEADVPGKGHFWRLRTHSPSGVDADQFCARLRAKGFSCIAVRS